MTGWLRHRESAMRSGRCIRSRYAVCRRGKGLFDRDQFAKMAPEMRESEGAFILSINDKSATEARELIVSNRETRTRLL
jgi:hypothetical protein